MTALPQEAGNDNKPALQFSQQQAEAPSDGLRHELDPHGNRLGHELYSQEVDNR